MKVLWLSLLVASSSALLIMLLKKKVPKGWLMRFSLHVIMAAFALYALNFSGWITGWYVPLNPVTIGSVALLGLPGIALVLGLQYSFLI